MPISRDMLATIGKKTLDRTVATSLFLIKIMVPVSLAVTLLGWSGFLQIIAGWLKPLMHVLGLPGEAALVYLSGALLNNYSAIAVMSTLELSVRDATILAVMCLISHNLIVETTVMKSIGSSALKMALLRIGTALVAGLLLNLVLPAEMATMPLFARTPPRTLPFVEMLTAWGWSTIQLIAKIVLYIAVLMLVQSLLEAFDVMEMLSKVFRPLMAVFGLDASMGFLWVVINVVGYAYGAGIVKAAKEEGRMTLQQGDLFNHHAAISHSLVEDTVLYAALSLPVFWLVVPRLLLSIVVVWLERLRRHYFKRMMTAGTI